MPPRKRFDINLNLPVASALIARVDAVLDENELRVEFIRKAIEAEVRRREAARRRVEGKPTT
jgi:metal-responsive CopG/Arc/MetJ family transcriptional regulator